MTARFDLEAMRRTLEYSAKRAGELADRNEPESSWYRGQAAAFNESLEMLGRLDVSATPEVSGTDRLRSDEPGEEAARGRERGETTPGSELELEHAEVRAALPDRTEASA